MWPAGKKPVVTLIDQNDRFLFKPLMYELLSGAATEDEVCPEYSQVLAPFQVRCPARPLNMCTPTPTQGPREIVGDRG